MELSTAYRATLTIPVALCALVLAPALIAGDALEHLGALGTWLGNGALAVAGESFWIGVPYVLYVMLAVAWSHGRSDAALRRALNLAPLLFAAWLVVVALALVLLAGGVDDWGWLAQVLGRVLGVVVLFGYVCVALAHAAIALGRRSGVIEPAA